LLLYISEGPPQTATRRYGWRRDHHDQSVETLAAVKKKLEGDAAGDAALPTSHDLRETSNLPPVLNKKQAMLFDVSSS
jgi:hypothetical protein